MVSGARDNPPPRQLYRAFICENIVPVLRVEVDSGLFITFIVYALSLSFPWSFDHSGFCRLNFTSLIWISALNPKLRHFPDTRHARN